MKSRFIILLTILALSLSACVSLAEDLTPPPNSSVPTAAPNLAPVFPAAAPNAADGQAIYAEKCAPCHGVTGLGDGEKSDQLPNPAAPLGERMTALQASPAAWYNAVTEGNIESFMPPFASLSDQERWDVVAYAYSLSINQENIAIGAELFAENCVLCHGEDGTGATAPLDLTDQSFMASRSAADFGVMIVNGSENGMPAFGGDFDDTQIAALTDYLRSLTMDFSGVEAASASPVDEEPATEPETEEAAEESAAESPAEEQEQAETESAPAEELGTISGSVLNGSGDGSLPQGLTIQLLGYDHDGATGSFFEAFFAETSINTDGTFIFEDVEMPVNRAFITVIEGEQLSFSSEPGFVTEGITSLELPITYYETSSDASQLTVDRLHIFFEFLDSTYETVQVTEVFVISNPSIYVIVPENEGEATINFDLPEDAENIEFYYETQQEEDDGRYIKTENGFGDTYAVAPGMSQHQAIVFFTLPYNKKMDFTQSINHPVDSAVLMAPQGIKIKSDLLSESGTRDSQGLTYNIFSSQPLPVGSTLEMNISGKLSATPSGSTEDTQKNLLFGVIAFGVVLIGAGAWMFMRKGNEEDEYDEYEEEDDGVEYGDSESIMDAIIALDDSYRDGFISEDVYKKRRAELKAQLKELVD